MTIPIQELNVVFQQRETITDTPVEEIIQELKTACSNVADAELLVAVQKAKEQLGSAFNRTPLFYLKQVVNFWISANRVLHEAFTANEEGAEVFESSVLAELLNLIAKNAGVEDQELFSAEMIDEFVKMATLNNEEMTTQQAFERLMTIMSKMNSTQFRNIKAKSLYQLLVDDTFSLTRETSKEQPD